MSLAKGDRQPLQSAKGNLSCPCSSAAGHPPKKTLQSANADSFPKGEASGEGSGLRHPEKAFPCGEGGTAPAVTEEVNPPCTTPVWCGISARD